MSAAASTSRVVTSTRCLCVLRAKTLRPVSKAHHIGCPAVSGAPYVIHRRHPRVASPVTEPASLAAKRFRPRDVQTVRGNLNSEQITLRVHVDFLLNVYHEKCQRRGDTTRVIADFTKGE